MVSGLACVSALTLRAPSNSKAFYDNAIPQIIATCMEMHRNSLYVQVRFLYLIYDHFHIYLTFILNFNPFCVQNDACILCYIIILHGI